MILVADCSRFQQETSKCRKTDNTPPSSSRITRLMKCQNPVNSAHGPVGCGQCIQCRINRQRQWTARLMMESFSHPTGSCYFATFTYSDANIRRSPVTGLPTLSKSDALAFRRRLSAIAGKSLRYFIVGEYGDTKQRPHLHAMFYGITAPSVAERMRASWTLGRLERQQISPFSLTRAAYIAGYTVKKHGKNPARLKGREPEFTLTCQKPALGENFLFGPFLRSLQSPAGQRALRELGDVPGTVRIGGRPYPLIDRHKRRLRVLLGLPELSSELEQRSDSVVAMPSLEEITDLRHWEANHVREKIIRPTRTLHV